MPHSETSISNQTPQPHALTSAKTPKRWCEAFFAKQGIKLCHRRMRADAISSGNFLSAGKSILLLPEHVDKILQVRALKPALEANRKCATTSNDELEK